MDAVERWFEKAAKRQDRLVTLYPSLLKNRLWPYFLYRLRYVFVLQALAFAFHVVEFLILLATAPKLGLLVVILLRAGSPLVRGVWWGAMEVLRERVRDMTSTGALRRVEQEISSWLVLGIILAALLLAVGFAWLAISPLASQGGALIDIYIVLIAVELAIRLPILTLHSGVYATRRIYRPFLSIVLPVVLQLAVVAALYGVFAEGALIVSIVIASACSTAVSYIYIQRMYLIAELKPRLALGIAGFGRFLAKLPSPMLFWSTAAGFLIRIDSLLVLIILGLESIAGNTIQITGGHPDWKTPHIGILLYLILPAIRGSYEWAILFYFDFVRLRRARELRYLAQIFFAKLVVASLVVGVFFWLLAASVFVVGYTDVPSTFLVALVPLFLVRAWLAVYQMRAFADGRFVEVCLSVLLLIGGIGTIDLSVFADLGDLMQLKICLLLTLVVLIAFQLYDDRRQDKPAVLLSLGDWCRSLAGENGAVACTVVRLADGVADKHRLAIRDQIIEALAGSGHVSWRDESTLLVFERAGPDGHVHFDPHALASSSAGLVTIAKQIDRRLTSGKAALERLVETGVLMAGEIEAHDLSSLTGMFYRRFPDGIVVDLDTSKRAKSISEIDDASARLAIPSAMHALRSGLPSTSCGMFRLVPVFLNSRLARLFLIDEKTEASQKSAWLNTLLAWSTNQAIGRNDR